MSLSEQDMIKANKQNMEWLRQLLELVGTSSPVVQFHILGRLTDTLRTAEDVLSKAESPIEQMLGIYLADIPEMLYAIDRTLYCEIQPQQEIRCENKTYRADFVVWVEHPCTGPSLKVVVECDGHDFHERTKEQAQRDRSRDRMMQAAGYHVLRFTGAEIWRGPGWCAVEVYRFIQGLLAKVGDPK